jgi:hypothetical protein
MLGNSTEGCATRLDPIGELPLVMVTCQYLNTQGLGTKWLSMALAGGAGYRAWYDLPHASKLGGAAAFLKIVSELSYAEANAGACIQ